MQNIKQLVADRALSGGTSLPEPDCDLLREDSGRARRGMRRMIAPVSWLKVLAITALSLGPLCSSQGESPFAPTKLIITQQQMVSELTGWSNETGQVTPFSRSSAQERTAAAAYLFGALSEIGLNPQRHRYRARNVNGLVDLLLPPYRGTNIYAVVPATTTSTEHVILGAHYDSEFRSPGAVDNASGVALVYAVAQAISKLDTRERNFVFVFFDQEEEDEVGSRAFARFLLDEGYEVHSAHTADLVGWDADEDRAVEIQSPAPSLESLYRSVANELSITMHVTQGASSDNKSFMAAGYTTVAISEEWAHDDSTPHLHRASDTYETLNFAYLASTTQLVLAVMQRLAQK